MTHDRSGFEVEVANIEEFLRLLNEREDESTRHNGRGIAMRAVFVAQMLDRRTSYYDTPLIRRSVVVAFAHGRDRVSYARTTSNAVELPETVARMEDRQQAAYEEVRATIERGLEDLNLNVRVHEGFLRHAADNGGVGRDESG